MAGFDELWEVKESETKMSLLLCLQRLRLKDFENSKLSTWAVLEGRLVWSGSHYMTNKVIRQREDMEDDIVTTLKSKKVICIVFLCLFMLLNSLVLHQQIPWGFYN